MKNIIYRFMCLKTNSQNYHVDFSSKEEALNYAEKLTDSKIEWYGVYEINSKYDHLIMVESKRLIPYNNTFRVIVSEETLS